MISGVLKAILLPKDVESITLEKNSNRVYTHGSGNVAAEKTVEIRGILYPSVGVINSSILTWQRIDSVTFFIQKEGSLQ